MRPWKSVLTVMLVATVTPWETHRSYSSVAAFSVFWHVTLCRLMTSYRSPEESYRLHFQGHTSLDPEFEGNTFFRNVLYIHSTIERNIPEDFNLQITPHSCKCVDRKRLHTSSRRIEAVCPNGLYSPEQAWLSLLSTHPQRGPEVHPACCTIGIGVLSRG